MIDVSIFLPSKGRPEWLAKAVANIKEEAAGLNWHLMVIADGLVPVVQDEHIRVLPQGNDLFRVYNEAIIKYAMGKWTLPWCDDVFFRPGALRRAIMTLDQHPDALAGVFYMSEKGTKCSVPLFEGVLQWNFGLVRSTFLKQLGGFNPSYPWMFQDTEIGFESWFAGQPVIALTGSCVVHERVMDAGRSEREQSFEVSRALFWKKWGPHFNQIKATAQQHPVAVEFCPERH